MQAINVTRGMPLATSGLHARSLWARSRGLLGRKGMMPGEGLLLDPCSGIHSFFMAFPFDSIFLDREGKAIHLIRNMSSMRMSRYVFKAKAVLELPAGTIDRTGTELGDKIAILD